jgi:hypothetical protein
MTWTRFSARISQDRWLSAAIEGHFIIDVGSSSYSHQEVVCLVSARITRACLSIPCPVPDLADWAAVEAALNVG